MHFSNMQDATLRNWRDQLSNSLKIASVEHSAAKEEVKKVLTHLPPSRA